MKTAAWMILVAGTASVSLGQLIITPIANDATLNALLPDTNTSWVAEGRIGDLGGAATFELDAGQSTAAPADTAQFAWSNNQPVDFTLSFDQGTNVLSFDVMGTSVSFSPSAAFDDLYIRTAAIRDISTVSLDGMLVDGSDAIPQVISSGPNDRDIIRVQNAGLADGFTLTGTATLAWDPSNVPVNSQLAFQFKAGITVPTPASAALLGTLGVAALLRRR